jgi:hypothetical protein
MKRSYNTKGVQAIVNMEAKGEKSISFEANSIQLTDLDEKTMFLEVNGPNETKITVKFSK